MTGGMRAVAGLLLVALAGCGSTDASRFSMQPAAVAHLHAKTVALNNYYKTGTPPPKFAGSDRLLGFTETAIAMLGQAMEKQGISVAVSPESATGKTVTLRVFNIRYSQLPNRIAAYVFLEAQYGDGKMTTVDATNASPVNAGRAVDGAVLFALNELVRHEDFVAYINR